MDPLAPFSPATRAWFEGAFDAPTPAQALGWPDDILDARELAFSHSWAVDPEDDRSQLRARILGGCSAHNACVLLEGAPSDYGWAPGWSYEELEPYLRRAERALRMRDLGLDELSPWPGSSPRPAATTPSSTR